MQFRIDAKLDIPKLFYTRHFLLDLGCKNIIETDFFVDSHKIAIQDLQIYLEGFLFIERSFSHYCIDFHIIISH